MVKTKILASIFENLSFMLDTGMSLLDALETLEKSGEKETKRIANLLKKEVMQGNDLAVAVNKHIKGFSEHIEAGIKSGELSAVLKRLSTSLETSGNIKAKVKSALAYPVFTLVITLIISFYMFTVLVPQMKDNIKEISGGDLPEITKTVLAISTFLTQNSILVIVIIAISLFIIRLCVKTIFKFSFSKLILKIPVLGQLFINMEQMNFYKDLAHLMMAGVPNETAFELSASSVNNDFMQKELKTAIKNFKEQGKSFGQSLETVTSIKKLEHQCILIADNSGKTAEILIKLANKKEEDTNRSIKTMLSLIEPILMVLMGGLIGLIMLAIYMPMLAMSGF